MQEFYLKRGVGTKHNKSTCFGSFGAACVHVQMLKVIIQCRGSELISTCAVQDNISLQHFPFCVGTCYVHMFSPTSTHMKIEL